MPSKNSAEQLDVVTPFAGGGTAKNNALLYAAGDVIVWVAPQNSTPPTGFEDVSTIPGASYKNCGWVDTSGYIFKLDETVKDIPAAGVLTPIRTILTGGIKSVQATLLEAINPYARALYDDVPIFPVTSSPLLPSSVPPAPVAPVPTTSASGGTVLAGTYQVKVSYVTASGGETLPSPAGSIVTTGSVSTITVPSPTTSPGATGWYAYVSQAGGSATAVTRQQTAGSPTPIGTGLTLTAPPTSTGSAPLAASTAGWQASYIIPDPPADNRYAVVFDSDDGIKQMRMYAPNAKVTARGNDQIQQADVTTLDLTWTFYPGTIGGVPGVAKRYIDYGQDVTAYFT